MIVTCDNCGKGYQIDSEQVEGETTSFRCDACDHVITVSLRTTIPGGSSPRNPGKENSDEPEYIHMAEEVVETLLSTPETPKEVPTETGSGEFSSPNLGAPEHLNLAEEVEATPISIAEIAQGGPSEIGSGGRRPTTSAAPEYINLAQEGVRASAPQSKIGLRDKVFFFVPICLIIVAGILLLIL